jgi:hypothetical protein
MASHGRTFGVAKIGESATAGSYGQAWDSGELTSLRRPCWVLATVTCLAVPGPAFGQRADENAVTAAQDAFGTTIGFQNVGL